MEFPIFIGILLALILVILLVRSRKEWPKQNEPIIDFSDIPSTHRYRDGGTVIPKMRDRFASGGAVDLDEPFRRAAQNVKDHPPKEAKYHPRPGVRPSGFAAKPRDFGNAVADHSTASARALPRVTLTPRQLERVNIQRKLRGRRPLNRAGFSNAVAHAWDQPRRQPETTNDWLTYFILYQVFFSGHESFRVSCDQGITISPDQPYNGHGGEQPGAGAAGGWTGDVGAAAAAAVIGAGTALTVDAGGDVPIPGGDGGYPSSPDPTPSYSAPDPSPTYSAPSYDSAPSPSFDSGGGGGGGGGGD